MRRLLALIFLTACSTPCRPPAPEEAIGWIEGERFSIAESWVFAEDNANSQWSVVLESRRAFPREFGNDLRAAWVEIGGVRHEVTGIGGSPEGTSFHLSTDRAGAQKLAKALEVPAGARIDPGLALRASLSTLRDPLETGGPVLARFVLTNAGPATIAFTSRSGVAGQVRDEDFAVEISRAGSALPKATAPPDLGGLRRVVELAPDQSVDFELDLAAWGAFTERGRYLVRVRYKLVAEPPDSFRSPAYAKAHQLWDEEVAAECKLTIE